MNVLCTICVPNWLPGRSIPVEDVPATLIVFQEYWSPILPDVTEMIYDPAGSGDLIRNVGGEVEICWAIGNHSPASGLADPLLFWVFTIETIRPCPVS